MDERLALADQPPQRDERVLVAHCDRLAVEVHARPLGRADEVLLRLHRLAVVVGLAGAPDARYGARVPNRERGGREALHRSPA